MSAPLPELAVNRGFMAEFVAAEPPCFALGLVEVGDARCALVALRPEAAIPKHVTARGFCFGHALLGAEDWEVVHFGFEFYGFATYNALINPSDPVARQVALLHGSAIEPGEAIEQFQQDTFGLGKAQLIRARNNSEKRLIRNDLGHFGPKTRFWRSLHH